MFHLATFEADGAVMLLSHGEGGVCFVFWVNIWVWMGWDGVGVKVGGRVWRGGRVGRWAFGRES